MKPSFLLTDQTQATCQVIGEHSGRMVEFRRGHGRHNFAICEGHIREAVEFLDEEASDFGVELGIRGFYGIPFGL